MKKALIILFLFLFANSLAYATISNYKVPAQIPLNQKLTIYGEYSDVNGSSGILCSSYIFDLNDQNQVIQRLDDIYTFNDGSFYFQWNITEPQFKRFMDYNAITKCGTSQVGSVFNIVQREDFLFGITNASVAADFKNFTDPNNSIAFIAIAIIIIIVGYAAARIVKS